MFQHEQCMHNFLIIMYRYFVNVKYMYISLFPSVLSVMFSPFFPQRTTEVGCESDMEFLAKVYCVRQASEVCKHTSLFICTCSVFHFKCFEMYHNLCLKLFKFTNCYIEEGVSQFTVIEAEDLFMIFPKLVNIPGLETIPFALAFSIISVQF